MIHMNRRCPLLIVWSLIFFLISAGAVTLRVISTQIRRRALKSHDYLVFFSLLLLTGYVVDMLVGESVNLLTARQPLLNPCIRSHHSWLWGAYGYYGGTQSSRVA
ncbi:hypothetical protein N7457_002624 [Penicillium paradoxum]|uniref:uncharacterized protein n=1 Tax=Penicillium paradoxum TaxID=176176 RepID=UPI0025471CE7|nr:uncharacterized protein N7457_002624 [Penicillium paradoxum]KAJ5787634.1 hypothetical protein N7457_002624 [Penicillium paradoxum]